MNTNNSFRIKNSRNEQATVWPIGNNTYFCSIKWDDEDSTMTVSKSAVDSLVECGEWNVVQEHKPSKLPDTFKFVTNVCEDHDGNVYTCHMPEDANARAIITWIGNDGYIQDTTYSYLTVQKWVEDGTWNIVEEEDEQEPDLMNYLYEIIRMDAAKEDGEETKEFVPTSFKYRHVDYPEQVGTFTATSPTTGIVTYDNQDEPCTYWDLKQAEKFVQRGLWIVIPPSEYVEDYYSDKDEDQSSHGDVDILRLISDFTASSKHYFVIEKGQMNVYHADNSIPYTCESEYDIVTVMNAIETLDNFTAD